MPYQLLDEEEPEYGYKEFGKDVQRNIVRQGSNIATRAIGLPGDILSLVNEYIAKPVAKHVFGQEPAEYEDTFLGKAIPTTETHRKGVEGATGEYLKPKNKIEEFYSIIFIIVPTFAFYGWPNNQIHAKDGSEPRKERNDA